MRPAAAGRRPTSYLWVLGAVAWLGSIGFGMASLLAYKTTPGPRAASPEQWPSTSQLGRTPGLPTLVMVAHPRCPCTRASVTELALLMTRLAGQLEAVVLFVVPDGVERDWEETDLWRRAAAIPGVTVRRDPGNREAHLFEAMTSGQTALYAADGRLLFRGGLTASRGHEGDNDGLESVVSLLTGGTAAVPVTAVFGCPLDSAQASASP